MFFMQTVTGTAEKYYPLLSVLYHCILREATEATDGFVILQIFLAEKYY